jgi:hypothetical protein
MPACSFIRRPLGMTRRSDPTYARAAKAAMFRSACRLLRAWAAILIPAKGALKEVRHAFKVRIRTNFSPFFCPGGATSRQIGNALPRRVTDMARSPDGHAKRTLGVISKSAISS